MFGALNPMMLAMSKRTLGERIRDARIAKGLSQSDLAKTLTVTPSAVSYWESGETKGLKPENLLACADALGV